MSLQIIKAKPNPTGKDRINRKNTSATQLAAEWIDFKNIGSKPFNLENIELYHLSYKAVTNKLEKVIGFTGLLGVGKVVRVHSGKKIPLEQMNYEDRISADHHLFSGKDYIWNNSLKDYPKLWNKKLESWIDETEYMAPVREGAILVRNNHLLV